MNNRNTSLEREVPIGPLVDMLRQTRKPIQFPDHIDQLHIEADEFVEEDKWKVKIYPSLQDIKDSPFNIYSTRGKQPVSFSDTFFNGKADTISFHTVTTNPSIREVKIEARNAMVEEETHHRTARTLSEYEETFTVPPGYDIDHMTARIRDGQLTIIAPRNYVTDQTYVEGRSFSVPVLK